MNALLRRFFKFSSSTIAGTVVDTTVLFALSQWVFSSYAGKYLAAPTLSFEAAVFTNYVFSYFWVWRGRFPRTARDFGRRFVLYNVNTALVFLGKLALLVVINYLTGLHVVLCNLLALLFSGIANFVLQDRLVFSANKAASPKSNSPRDSS